MDYEAYQSAYFVQPPPAPRFQFRGAFGVTLYFAAYETAVAFYTDVLGPPAYVEGAGTRGWRIGDGWLTLLAGENGRPQNVEITLLMATPAEAERLQQAFVTGGGSGSAPVDTLMYEPIRYCAAQDPFGVPYAIISPLPGENA